jgi:hypothetical protein
VFIIDQFEIVAVKRDTRGNLTNFKLNNGQELDYNQTIQMAETDKIKGVNIIHRKDRKVLRGVPDGEPGNNFDNLPTF